jgi:hypothetical protein
VRLWQDALRVEQLARLDELELQPGDEYGQHAWNLAYELWRNLPEGARIDLPSPRVFGRVLGLMRTGATLKSGKLLRLEISAEEMAELLGYSKSTVEAALRWLDSGPIEYEGTQIARGLGLIHRGRRTAWGYLDGIFRRVYRTSRTVLTLLGRMLLGLGPRDEERKREQREAKARIQRDAKAPAPAATTVPEAKQGESRAGESPPGPEADRYDVGLAAIRKICEAL